MKGVDGKKDNKLYCENKTDSELIFVGLLLQRRKPRVLCHSIYTGHKPGACDDGSTSVCA